MPITVVNFRQNSKLLILSIIRKVFNSQRHNLSFRGGYIPPESPTKIYGISGRNEKHAWTSDRSNSSFYLSKIGLIPFIIANL